MLESLLILTLFNCVFMFSTTVTTCALLLRNKHDRCCVIDPNSEIPLKTKEKVKRNLKGGLYRGKRSLQKLSAKLAEKKRDFSKSREEKLTMKKNKSEMKSLGIMAEPDLKDIQQQQQQLDATCCAKLTSTEDLPRANRKPIIVTEISTVQKVVQVIDKDRTSSNHSLAGDCVSRRSPADADQRIQFTVQKSE